MAYGHESTAKPGRNGQAWYTVRDQLKAMPGSDVCWRCGKKIDMSLPNNDPGQWTADHVQSLASGGDPLSLSNLKPAHRSCNSKRGRQLQDNKNTRRW